MFTFKTAPVVASKAKKPRKKNWNTPVHNYMDMAAAILAMAEVIDPAAFVDDDELRTKTPDQLQRIALRRSKAMEAARACQRIYEYHLGNQHNVTLVMRNKTGTRFLKIKRGKPAAKI